MITKNKKKCIEEYCLLNSSFCGHSVKCKFRINSLIYKNYKYTQNEYDGHFSMINQLFNHEMDIIDEARGDINDYNNLLNGKTLQNPYGEGYSGSSMSSSSCSSDDDDDADEYDDESDSCSSSSSSPDPWRQQFLKSSRPSRVPEEEIGKFAKLWLADFRSVNPLYCVYCGCQLIIGSAGNNICNDCKDNDWIGDILVDTSHATHDVPQLAATGLDLIPNMPLSVVERSKSSQV